MRKQANFNHIDRTIAREGLLSYARKGAQPPERNFTMPRKPVIGITPSPTTLERPHGAFHTYGIADTYTTAIEAAGGIPVVIPPQDGNAAQLAGLVDGLLISGGGDINPIHYGEDAHPETGGIHQGRDHLEFGLLREAIANDIPTLCICRGIQVLNVVRGGTLYQDVPDLFGADLEHRQFATGIERQEPSHTVSAQEGSLLARVYGATSIDVNSFHHQGLKDLGEGLVAIGWAPDGLIEAVELPGHRWLLGVQWHPEMMYAAHDEHLRPFRALVEAAVSAPAISG